MDLDLVEETLKTAPSAGAAAGIWWATVLMDPKHDNGADDEANVLSRMMADMLTADHPAEAGALDLFAGYLKEEVDKMLEDGRDWISFGVDYHPDRILADCAEKAYVTVPMMGWPWKTNMWVTPRNVKVSYGYGAEAKIIWGEED